MVRSSTRGIINKCAAGRNLDDEIRRAIGFHAGNIFFVDRNAGNDGSSGESWEEALLTVAQANSKCTTRNNDVIVFRGRLTSGNRFSDSQEITKDGVHLLGAGYIFGHGGGRDSVFVNPQTVATPSNASLLGNYAKGGLILGANNIEVAGIYFYSPDATQVQCNITTDDSRYSCSIHDNWFQGSLIDGAGVDDRTTAIALAGMSQGYIGHNFADAPEQFLHIQGGSARYNHTCIIEHNVITRPKYTFYLMSGASECFYRKNRTLPRGGYGYGYALTRCYHIEAGANYNMFEDEECYQATKETVVADSGTGNVFRRLYYDVTSGAGTLYES